MQLKYRSQFDSPGPAPQNKIETISLRFGGQSYPASNPYQPSSEAASKPVLRFLGRRYTVGLSLA